MIRTCWPRWNGRRGICTYSVPAAGANVIDDGLRNRERFESRGYKADHSRHVANFEIVHGKLKSGKQILRKQRHQRDRLPSRSRLKHRHEGLWQPARQLPVKVLFLTGLGADQVPGKRCRRHVNGPVSLGKRRGSVRRVMFKHCGDLKNGSSPRGRLVTDLRLAKSMDERPSARETWRRQLPWPIASPRRKEPTLIAAQPGLGG